MDVFDEIIEALRIEQKYSEHAYIHPDTLKEFYTSVSSAKQNTAIDKGSHYTDNNGSEFINASKRESVRQSRNLRSSFNSEQSHLKNVSFAGSNYAQMDMEQLKNTIAGCSKCELCRTRTNIVFGEGSYSAELMLIGEGPGRDEDLQGRPFVGRSGQLLTKMLKAMGYERNEVFIANIVKCRPPNNRNPHPEEADLCMPYLIRQIEIIKPKVLILLGAVPMKFLLNKTGITRIHGQWFDFRGIRTLPTFHPSFLLRDPRQKKYAWEDLQKAMEVLGKTYNKGR